MCVCVCVCVRARVCAYVCACVCARRCVNVCVVSVVRIPLTMLVDVRQCYCLLMFVCLPFSRNSFFVKPDE